MKPFIAFPLFLAFVFFGTASCTLTPLPPTYQVNLKMAAPAGRDLPISSLACVAVLVEGEAGEVSRADVGTRDPLCLGLRGKYKGAFAVSTATSGAKINLAAGQYTFTLVALNKAGSCDDRALSYFLPNSDTGVADTYVLGSVTTEVTPSTTKVTVTADQYDSSNPTNLTTACPRQSSGCSGFAVCDTFTDSDGTHISAHFSESAIYNAYSGGYSPVINANRLNIMSDVTGFSYFVANGVSRDQTINATMVLGSAGSGTVAIYLLSRVTDTDNYVMGHITHTGSGPCNASIRERVAGVEYLRVTSGAISCSASYSNSLALTTLGNLITFSFNGVSINYGSASGALVGTYTGFGGGFASTETPPYIDDFRVNFP